MGCLIHLGTLLTGGKIPLASPCLFKQMNELRSQCRGGEATNIIPNSWFAKQLSAE